MLHAKIACKTLLGEGVLSSRLYSHWIFMPLQEAEEGDDKKL